MDDKIIAEKTAEIDRIKAEIDSFTKGKADLKKLAAAVSNIDSLIKSLTDLVEKEESK